MHSCHAAPKSLGHEVTFAADTADPELLAATLLDLADRTASALRRQGLACRTLTLKLRDEQFRTRSRQCTLPAETSSTRVIYEAALALLAAVHVPGHQLRLLGLTLSGLAGEQRQLELERVLTRSLPATRRSTRARQVRRTGAAPRRRRPRALPGPGAARSEAAEAGRRTSRD